MHKNKSKNVALGGLLLALTITFSAIESIMAPFLALPFGIRLGLANTVIMYTALFISKQQAFIIVISKSGFVFLTRGAVAGILSFSGSITSFLVIALILSLPFRTSLYITSIIGAVTHNLAQLFMVRFITSPIPLNYYLPLAIFLTIAGIIMGAITAFILTLLINKTKKITSKEQIET